MRIAISAKDTGLDAAFDPRFGRASHFVFVDDETEAWECYANPAGGAGGGAGVQAAQFVANHGSQAVISGDFGPNAFEALSRTGIQMILAGTAAGQTVQDVLQRFREGRLAAAESPGRRGHRRR